MAVSESKVSEVPIVAPEDVREPEKTKGKPKSSSRGSLYMKNILTRKVYIPFVSIGSNIKELIEEKLKHKLEGRCVYEGYVQTGSIRVVTFSSGNVISNNVVFDVTFECLICNPVEGLNVKVQAKNITKAGIRAIYAYSNEENTPIDVFISRDHYYNEELFNSIKKDDIFKARVIGQRFELNDTSVSVLASIVSIVKK